MSPTLTGTVIKATVLQQTYFAGNWQQDGVEVPAP